MQWWQDERSLEIESPYSNSTHLVYRYAVNNTAPRPESYLTGKPFQVSNLTQPFDNHVI